MNLDKLRDDGSLVMGKWILICCIVGIIGGGLIGAAKVILFETNASGETASFKKCALYDDRAAADFEEQHDPRDTSSAPDFCIRYETATMSTGDRAKELMKNYAAYGFGLSFVPGIIIGTAKKDKQ